MNKSTLLLLAIVLAVFGTSVAAGHPDWGTFTGLAIILLAAGLAAGALPIQSDEYFEDRAGATQRISKSLVTLSSAAVVAIYAAGYHRTSTAAERFDQEAEQRKRGATIAAVAPLAISNPATNPAPAGAAAAPGGAAPAVKKNNTSKPAAARKSAATPGESGNSGDSGEPGAAASSAATKIGGNAGTEAAAAQSKFKDGSFLGWGSCPHGDIEASVTIQGGKIVSSAITQCLTRYSCSWISPRVPSEVLPDLPRQVVERQSAKVDYVSGATESSYAFADAIIAALSKASE